MDGIWQSRICQGDLVGLRIVNRVCQCAVLALNRSRIQRLVYQLQHLSGRILPGGACADDAAGKRRVERGWRAFAGDVSHNNGESPIIEIDKVVKVAAKMSDGFEC